MDLTVTLGKGPLGRPIGAQEKNGFCTVPLGKGPLGQPTGAQEMNGFCSDIGKRTTEATNGCPRNKWISYCDIGKRITGATNGSPGKNGREFICPKAEGISFKILGSFRWIFARIGINLKIWNFSNLYLHQFFTLNFCLNVNQFWNLNFWIIWIYVNFNAEFLLELNPIVIFEFFGYFESMSIFTLNFSSNWNKFWYLNFYIFRIYIKFLRWLYARIEMNFAIRIFGYSESMSISTLNLCLNETNFEIENFELYSWTNCDQIIRKYGQQGGWKDMQEINGFM